MENKKILDKLNWYGCKTPRAGHVAHSQTITVSKSTCHGEVRYCIYFRYGSYKNIAKNIDPARLAIAVYKNRIFFKEDECGMKVSFTHGKRPKEENATGHIAFLERKIGNIDAFIGDYDLHYDEFYELYYIEREEIKA